MRELELLAPAADKHVALQAILHGADAVYMGASSHGARSKAMNSIDDIREVVEFAHTFRAKVYVTVNTLVYNDEIAQVEKLVRDLYRIGVDALIVQDMSLLRMNIPPIQLHASTQCDTRSVGKARFLEQVGFSQIVLARELSLSEIAEICRSVSVPVECFVHGALCVSYSGRCQASEWEMGRSGNRGECAQMCRLPYTLRNGRGEVLENDKYLLSLRDFNASQNIGALIEAGVSSFKIEGRLKDAGYVKNVTAAYRRLIDDYILSHPGEYRRPSYGESVITFEPQLSKSFNRGFTTYFLNGTKEAKINSKDRRMASIDTPKSQGERVESMRDLHNGDGISYKNPRTGEFEGFRVNNIINGRAIGSRRQTIPSGVELFRTFDIEWQKQMERETGRRSLWVDMSIDASGITARDERGISVRLPLDAEIFPAQKPMSLRTIFEKLGNTVYTLRNFDNRLPAEAFIRASDLTRLRRDVVGALDIANLSTYPFSYRRAENKEAVYPDKQLISSDNCANSLAEQFYKEHGVEKIEPALETIPGRERAGVQKKRVMTTRYCLRRELGCCKKECAGNPQLSRRYCEPLTISTGPHTFELEFDCKSCEMHVISVVSGGNEKR